MEILIRQFTTLSLLLILLLLLPLTATAGKIYKHIDADGNITYSQNPPSETAEEFKVKVRKPVLSDKDNKKQLSLKEKVEKLNKSKQANKESSAKKQKELAARKTNCDLAKRNLSTIKGGGRLYDANEAGERTYWDDNMRAQRLSGAKKNVADWCN